MRRRWPLLVLLPLLCGFDGSQAREALDLAFHNLYGSDVLAGVELLVESPRGTQRIGFAYGRKQSEGETRTLLYTTSGRRDAPRALLFQTEGEHDRMFLSEGTHGRVRPLATGAYRWALFGSDFSYADFRAQWADAFGIEVLGRDVVQGEPTRVLRLRPIEGPYEMLLVWLSTKRPVIMRTDYFDEAGLWKRYRVERSALREQLGWWVPMRDEMQDLRTGSRSRRIVRNIVVDAEVPDEVFSVTQLSRGRLPRF